jgi:hypothetical protein
MRTSIPLSSAEVLFALVARIANDTWGHASLQASGHGSDHRDPIDRLTSKSTPMSKNKLTVARLDASYAKRSKTGKFGDLQSYKRTRIRCEASLALPGLKLRCASRFVKPRTPPWCMS